MLYLFNVAIHACTCTSSYARNLPTGGRSLSEELLLSGSLLSRGVICLSSVEPATLISAKGA